MNFPNLTDQQIDQRGLLTHEPRWLRQQRQFAWDQFRSSPDTNWKRSKMPKLDLDDSLNLQFPDGNIEPLKVEKKPPANCSGKIVLQDGKVLRISLKPDLAYQGVIFCDMQTAVLERADLLEGYIKESPWGIDDQFTALHRALWENGMFLYVPAGLEIDEPFQIQVIQKDHSKSILQRSVVILEQGSRAVVEEICESQGVSEQRILNSMSTEVFTEDSAQLKYYSTQNWSEQVYDLSYHRFNAGQNTNITSLLTLLGAQAGRVVVSGDAQAVGASVQHDGIIVAGNKQRFQIIAEMEHQAQQTEGMMRYKGILKDEAYSYLDGLIRVEDTAQHASSRLEEHTLLLSEKARCDALPALDIRTDDVQASHSASVTKVDGEKLFYLMSRGLSEDDARHLMVQGFFEDLLSSIKTPHWYEETKQLIEQKLSL